MKAAAPQKSTDNCWDLFKNPDYPDQRRHANPGSKFGAGFMRRQQPAIKQDEVRLAYAEERSARLQQAAVLRTERLVANSNVAYHGRAPTPPHHERSYTCFLLLHALSNDLYYHSRQVRRGDRRGRRARRLEAEQAWSARVQQGDTWRRRAHRQARRASLNARQRDRCPVSQFT